MTYEFHTMLTKIKADLEAYNSDNYLGYLNEDTILSNRLLDEIDDILNNHKVE